MEMVILISSRRGRVLARTIAASLEAAKTAFVRL
jgi:hypothetical protein